MKNKKTLKVKLLVLILITSIIPLIFLNIFVNINLGRFLEDQGKIYYSNLLDQLVSKIEENLNDTTIKISDLTKLQNFKKLINYGEYKSQIEEKYLLDSFGENVENYNTIAWTIQTNFNGLFSIIEEGKRSLLDNTPYKIHYIIGDFGLRINYDELKKENLYKLMLELRKPVFGKLTKNSVGDYETRPVIIYPYYKKENSSIPEIIMVYMFFEEDINNKFVNNKEFFPGTLFMLDFKNNIISYNHPSRNDYYYFDKDKKKYVLEGQPIFNETNLSFYDYQNLITSKNIFNTPQMVDFLQLLDINEVIDTKKHIEELTEIKYLGKEYFVLFSYSIKYNVKFIFFLPKDYLKKPLITITISLIISFLLIIVILIIFSNIISGIITKPIIKLSQVMNNATKGDLDLVEKINSNDEIEILYDSYNNMVKNLVITQSMVDVEEQELNATRLVAITALAKLAEYRDSSTGKHLERVREYTRIIVTELRKNPKYSGYITDKYINDIVSSSVLHDIGKVAIESSILLKNGKLTPEEFEIIKTHTIIGGEALAEADKELGMKSFLTLAKEICYYHHEKYDGTGYPKGLKGDDIPLSARIVALADVYDALTADRCYRKALSHIEATDIIINKDIGHFDPDILECFINNQDKFIEIKNFYKNIN